MKVCYVDESGNTAEDPCLAMVGIVADAQRLNRTREEFAGIFNDVQGLFEENLRELKATKLILGRDRWRKIDPEVRKNIVEYLCTWVAERKHRLALAAIDRDKLAAKSGAVSVECRDAWLAGALHIALQVQKAHQTEPGSKGATFLIFDDNKLMADRLSELLWQPPPWTDSFYDRGKKQSRFDQIVDTTFHIKSHHAGLVQVADLFAFIFRRYSELADFNFPEEWKGERALIEHYVGMLSSRLFARRLRWPPRAGGECAAWYNSVAPGSLLALAE